jgi:hypothetical protein
LTDFVARLDFCAGIEIAGSDLLGNAGESTDWPDDLARDQYCERDADQQRESSAEERPPLCVGQTVAAAAQVCLEKLLLVIAQILEELEHDPGDWHRVGPKNVEVFAGMFTFDRVKHLVRKDKERIPRRRDLGQVFSLGWIEQTGLVVDYVPLGFIGAEVCRVFVLKAVLTGSDIASETRHHRNERRLECAHLG